LLLTWNLNCRLLKALANKTAAFLAPDTINKFEKYRVRFTSKHYLTVRINLF
jgi:hypothetical protein